MINVGDLLTVLRLQDELTPGVVAAVSQLQELDKAAQLTAYKLTLLGRGLTEAGVLATAAFTVPIIGALEATLKFGSEFETQMTRVVTLAGATREQVDGMRDSVMKLATESAVAPAELAKGMYVLMSTGRSTAEAMDVLRVASQMTALGMGDMHDTTLAITGAMFAYKDTNLSAADAANVLIKAVQLGNMEIQDLVPAIARVNPVAAALGVSFQDVAAGMATFTHAGVDSAVAATGMRAMLSNILTDSEKTEKGFKALGDALKDSTITMANFRQEMKDKGFTTAMVDLMNKVTAAGDAGVSAINKIFPNIRALTEALFVYKTNGGLVVDMMQSMNDGQDQLARGMKELEKTWAFQWQQMQVSVQDLWITLSDSLIPILKNVLAMIQSGFPILQALVRWFNELPTAIQITVLGFSLLVAGIGPLMILLGQLIQAYGNISRAITTISWGAQTAAIAENTVAVEANTIALTDNVVALEVNSAKGQWWAGNWSRSLGEMKGWAIGLNVAMAAIAGWELGRLIAQIFDLDNKIANLTARILEMGDLAAETAQARQAVIDKAIKSGASAMISYSDAIEWNRKVVEINLASSKRWADIQTGLGIVVKGFTKDVMGSAIANQTLLESVAALSAVQRAAINAGKNSGLNPKEILDYLTQQGLATGVTAEIIGVYERQTNKAAAATKAHEIEVNKLNTAFEKIVNSVKVTDGIPDKIFGMSSGTRSLIDKLTGEDLVEKVKDLSDALSQIVMMGKDSPKVLNAAAEAAGKLAREGADLTPQLVMLAAAFGEFGPIAKDGITAKLWDDFGEKIDVNGDKYVKMAKAMSKETDTYGKSLSILSSEFTKLGQISNGALSSVFQSMGALIIQLKTAHDLTKQIGGSQANKDKEKPSTIGGNFGAGSVMFSDLADNAQKAAAAIAAAGSVVNGAMAVWSAALASGSKSASIFNGAMAGMQAGAIFGPWGAAIGGAAGAITGWIASLSAGRRAVEAFAKSMGGFDTLHQKLLDVLGDVGENFWIELTQKIKRGDKGGADALIKTIQDALKNAPVSLAEEAGFKTMEEYQKIEDKAKEVYDFMLASGKYSAAELEKAWKAYTDAHLNNMSDEEKTYKDTIDKIDVKYKALFDKLDKEYQTLSDAVAGEAEEAAMGVVETQQRARMAQIEAEKAALEVKKTKEIDAAKAIYDEWLETGKVTDAALRELFQRPYKIPIEWDPGAGPGGRGAIPMKDGGDFLVTRPTLFMAGEAGPERATFSGANRGFKGGGTSTIVVKTYLNAREVAEAVVPEIPGVVQDYGL